jgi:hypothetical protein
MALNNRIIRAQPAVVIDHSEEEGSDGGGLADGSDHDEFIVHTDGVEEIHITRKAKRQLKMPVAHFKSVKPLSSSAAHLNMSRHQNNMIEE